MPPLKQPVPLRDLAMESLITFLSDFCHKHKAKDSLDELRAGIAIMKKDICPQIPWNLSADFHEKFLKKFIKSHQWPVKFPPSHMSAVTEILTDKKIAGLRCTQKTLTSLNPDVAHRVQGLKELDVRCLVYAGERYGIDKLQLTDLTSINMKYNSTDSALETIGKNCRKLESLNASYSNSITDKGLRGLIPCTELISVNFTFSHAISHNGIVEFLSGHEKVEKFSAWETNHSKDFAGLFQSGLKPFLTISELRTRVEPVSSDHLRTIAVMFPNLKSLGFFQKIVGDLTILKNLGKLSQLDFNWTDFSRGNLKEFLTLIGDQLTDLRLCCLRSQACVTQKQLDFLFKYCGNIEGLEFQYLPRVRNQKLIIPPFRNLKRLECFIARDYSNLFIELKFARMVNLEQLTMFRSHLRTEQLTMMVLDRAKCPNLKLIQMHEVTGNYKLDGIRKIAKDNNLDFKISNLFMFE